MTNRDPAEERSGLGVRGASGFVAVVGRPNVGKSTFVNTAVGEKVSIVSPRPQTTRDRIRGILTRPKGQLVLVDTPGIHGVWAGQRSPRDREGVTARGRGVRSAKELNRRMVQRAMVTLREADAILHLVDAAKVAQGADRAGAAPRVHPLDAEIREGIRAAGTPAVLALNKVDRVRKPRLLPIIDAYAGDGGLGPYRDLVPLCARDKVDVERVLVLLYGMVPEGPAFYPADQLSDRNDRFLAAELVREKVFLETREELPYATAVQIDGWEEQGRLVRIHARVVVERQSQRAIVIGRGGSMVKRIGTAARIELESLLGRKVYLELAVAVEERWSERPDLLDRFGYGAGGDPGEDR